MQADSAYKPTMGQQSMAVKHIKERLLNAMATWQLGACFLDAFPHFPMISNAFRNLFGSPSDLFVCFQMHSDA